MTTKILTARTLVDLVDKIYKDEGWVKQENEPTAVRCVSAGWVFSTVVSSHVYVAEKKEA